MSKTSWLAVLALLVGACRSQETPEQAQARMGKETDALRTAADAIARRYEAWVAAGQGDSLASVFTEDGREMPPNAPALAGRPAIAKFEDQNAAVFASKLAIRGEAYAANGPLGVERGSFVYSAKAQPKAPKGTPATVSEDGKYMIYWRNVNNQWQIAALIWNANAPRPAPAKPSHPSTRKKTKTKTKTKRKK
jgi:ketosteroid isomerase-like protein